jgi:UDP-3-O-[3-hydroxymyristoyl] glucosamine N-acyltransferase
MEGIVLFAAGSPVAAELEESCARLGWPILAAYRNRPGRVWTSEAIAVVDVDAATVLRAPVLLPLFTPANRQVALDEARGLGATHFPALIDPTAIVPRALAAGEGAYVNAGCTIGAAVHLGRFAFVNRAASLGHHCVLGDFASVGPGAVLAGQVQVGEAAMIGAGAVVLPGVRIGARAVVPAGAVLRHDLPDGSAPSTRTRANLVVGWDGNVSAASDATVRR